MKRTLTLAIPFALVFAVLPASPAAAQKWYEKAVKKVEGKFSPAEAKPGQTVTFTLTVELNDGYHTYPTVQLDKQAAGMVNDIRFPDPGVVIFVDKTEDPKDAKTKAEPELGILEMSYCTGTVTYTRKAVVSPKAAAGAAAIKLAKFSLSVCDKDNCFPPKTIPIEAMIKVLDGPAVEVEKAYADEVQKALGK
jgi:dihydroorotate dehydrogenase